MVKKEKLILFYKTKAFIACIFTFLCFTYLPAGAESLISSRELLSHLDGPVYDRLINAEHVFRYDREGRGPELLPDSAESNAIKVFHRRFEPEVMVEALYSVPYPDRYETGTKDVLKEVLKEIYVMGHRVSTISGVKYYSRRKQDYEILFTDVYAINNPEDKKKIADPVADNSLSDKTIYLHMKENAMGKGYYRMDYKPVEDGVSVMLTNESSLGFIITAVDEGDMVIRLQIIPCSDRIIIYGYCGVILQNSPLVNIMMDPYYSFYRRMTAMETWFYNNLHGTDKLPPLAEPIS